MIRRKQSVKTSARSETAKGELSLADLASVVGGLTASPGRRPDVDPVHMLLLDETHPGEAGEALGYAASKSAAESAASEKGVSAPAVPAGTNLEKAVPPVATADRLVAAAADKTLSDRSTGGMATAEVPKPNPGAPPAERAEPEQAARSPANTGLSAGQEAGKAGADVGTRGIAVGQAAAAPAMPGLDSSVVAKSAVASDPIKVASELAAQQDDGPQAVAGGEPDIAETGAADAGPFKGDHKAVQDAAHKFAAENPDAVNAMANKAKLEMEAAEKALKYPHGVFSPYHWRNEQAEMNRFVSIVYAKKAELAALKGWTDADAKAAGDGNKDAQAKIAASVAAFSKVASSKIIADAAVEQAAAEMVAAYKAERAASAKFAVDHPELLQAALKRFSAERASAEQALKDHDLREAYLTPSARLELKALVKSKLAEETALKGWTEADAAATDKGDAIARAKIAESIAALKKVAADHVVERDLANDFMKTSAAIRDAAAKADDEAMRARAEASEFKGSATDPYRDWDSARANELSRLEHKRDSKETEAKALKGWTAEDSACADRGDKGAQARIAASMAVIAKFAAEEKAERDATLNYAKTSPSVSDAISKVVKKVAGLQDDLGKLITYLKEYYPRSDGQSAKVVELKQKIAAGMAEEKALKGWTKADAAAADRGDKQAQAKIAESMGLIKDVITKVNAERAAALDFARTNEALIAAANKVSAERDALAKEHSEIATGGMQKFSDSSKLDRMQELGKQIAAKNAEERVLRGWTEAEAKAADRGDKQAQDHISASMKAIGKYITEASSKEEARKEADAIRVKDEAYAASIMKIKGPFQQERTEAEAKNGVPTWHEIHAPGLVFWNVHKFQSIRSEIANLPQKLEEARGKAEMLKEKASKGLEFLRHNNPFEDGKEHVRQQMMAGYERVVSEQTAQLKALSGVSDTDFRAANNGDKTAQARLDAAYEAHSKVAEVAYNEQNDFRREDDANRESFVKLENDRVGISKKALSDRRDALSIGQNVWKQVDGKIQLQPIPKEVYTKDADYTRIQAEVKFAEHALELQGQIFSKYGVSAPSVERILEEMKRKPAITDDMLNHYNYFRDHKEEYKGKTWKEYVSKIEKDKTKFDLATLARAARMGLHSDEQALAGFASKIEQKNKVDTYSANLELLKTNKESYDAVSKKVSVEKTATQDKLVTWYSQHLAGSSLTKADLETRDRLQLSLSEKMYQEQVLGGLTASDKAAALGGDSAAQAKSAAFAAAFKQLMDDFARDKVQTNGDATKPAKEDKKAEEEWTSSYKPKYPFKEEGKDKKPFHVGIEAKRMVIDLFDRDLFDHLKDDKGKPIQRGSVAGSLNAMLKTQLSLDGIDLGASISATAKIAFFKEIRNSKGDVVARVEASVAYDGTIETTFKLGGTDTIAIAFKGGVKAAGETSISRTDKLGTATAEYGAKVKGEVSAEAEGTFSLEGGFKAAVKSELGVSVEAGLSGMLKGEGSENAIGGGVGVAVGVKAAIKAGTSMKDGVISMSISFKFAAGLGFSGNFDFALDTKKGFVGDASKSVAKNILIPFFDPEQKLDESLAKWALGV